jgi:hypothetical protein
LEAATIAAFGEVHEDRIQDMGKKGHDSLPDCSVLKTAGRFAANPPIFSTPPSNAMRNYMRKKGQW